MADQKQRLRDIRILPSGVVTIATVVATILLLAIGWHEHIQGHFGRLKRELKGQPQVSAPVIPPPGGQDPIVLERSTIEGGMVPELLSATFLPGRGMQLLQLKAYLPGKGEVSLLTSPPNADAYARLSGKNEDRNGFESLGMGAAFEMPWAGRIYGQSAGEMISVNWNGKTLRLPASSGRSPSYAPGGLFLRQISTARKTNVMPDGGETEVSFDAVDFNKRWPSRAQVTMTAQLSGHALELKVIARNIGDDALPLGIGWSPRLTLPSAHREGVTLHIPSVTRLERIARTGEPTGKLINVANTPYDFTARSGVRLGNLELDDTYVNMRQAPLDSGPVIELRDPAANYGLRFTILSSSIKALHVTSLGNQDDICISPRFNFDDPFGRQWDRATVDTGMVVLQPGQTAQWRLRLEIFSLSSQP